MLHSSGPDRRYMTDYQEDISGRKDKEDDGNRHEESKEDDDKGVDADLVIYLVFHLLLLCLNIGL